MKNIAGWVGASAIITVLWGACTVTTDDNGGAGHAGTGGSSTGTGGTSSTGGAGSATGGSAGATDGGPTDAKADAAPRSDCQVCGEGMCSAETLACKQDTAGCGRIYQDLYDCISTSGDVDGCVTMFIADVNSTDGGASRLNDLGGCLDDKCATPCSTPTD